MPNAYIPHRSHVTLGASKKYMTRIISFTALAAGLLISLIGASFVSMYVIEAFLKRLGDADQSPIFWYLPILFIGVGVFSTGVLLSIWGTRRLQKLKTNKPAQTEVRADLT